MVDFLLMPLEVQEILFHVLSEAPDTKLWLFIAQYNQVIDIQLY
jgi:hypothetical protein